MSKIVSPFAEDILLPTLPHCIPRIYHPCLHQPVESYDKGVFLGVFSIIWRSLRTGKLHINNYYYEERRSAWFILHFGLWAQNNSALLETWIRCNASYYGTSLQHFHYRSPHRSQKQKGNNNADGFWGIKKVPLTLCLQCSFTPARNFFQIPPCTFRNRKSTR
jgi:hypothetical protein